MLSKVVISCLGCRKKKKTTTRTTINNKGQQWTTKHRQSTPAVIAEASRSTRYGTWSVAETAIRDLQTQTPRGVLARLGKKKTTTKTTWDNKGGSSHSSERIYFTTNYTNLHEYVPRMARNEKEKTTTRTTPNNKVPRRARNKNILPRTFSSA